MPSAVNQPDPSPAGAGEGVGLPLFYRNPTILRAAEHAGKAVLGGLSYSFAAKASSAPVATTEFSVAGRDYPIVFAVGSTVRPLAVLGLTSGENLFVTGQGQWRSGAYVPAYLRRYPFILAQSGTPDTRTLCIDAPEETLGESDEQDGARLLFTREGNATPFAQEMLQLCEAWRRDEQDSITFAHALKDHDLLVEQRMTVTTPQKRSFNIGGFHIVDEQKLRSLGSKTVSEWHRKGWLSLATLHLASLQNWRRLGELLSATKPGTAISGGAIQ